MLISVPTVLAAVLVVIQVWMVRHGLDLGDESYQLSLMAGPAAERSVGEPYLLGPFLHHLYAGFNGDIALLRLTALGGLAVVASVCSDAVLRFVAVEHDKGLTVTLRAFVAATTVGVATVAFLFNPRVPSYRWLALLGLTLGVLALVHALRANYTTAGILLAVGTTVSAMGKVTTAAALLPGFFVAAAVAGVAVWPVAWRWALVQLPALGLALLACGLAPSAAVEYVRTGVELHREFGGYSSTAGLFGIGPQPIAIGLALAIPFAVIWGSSEYFARRVDLRRSPWARIVTPLVILGVGLGECLSIGRGAMWREGGSRSAPVMLLLLLLALVGLFTYSRRRPQPLQTRPTVALMLTLLFSPYVFALGSNGPLGEQMAQGSYFWVIACVATVVALSAGFMPSLRGLSVAASFALVPVMVLTYVQLIQGGERAVGASETRVVVGGGTLLLPADVAGALKSVAWVASDEGITAETPVVDVTGVSPGYLFQLGGRPLGRPYFFGTFPTAERSALMALSHVPCSLRARAWGLSAARTEENLIPPDPHAVPAADDSGSGVWSVAGTLWPSNTIEGPILLTEPPGNPANAASWRC